jgi:glycosyltransferase involved in cell wall biosynthesis
VRIIYSHDIFSFQAYGGISRYFVEIAKRIPTNEVRVQIFAGLHINEYLKGLVGLIGLKLPALKNRGWTARVINASLYYMRKSINDVMQQALISIDHEMILHLTYYTRPPVKRKLKLVVTVYDMIPELFGQYFPHYGRAGHLKRLCCERADKIIAISNCTKKDLMNLFGMNNERITVIYLGNPLENIPPAEERGVTQTPYVLYVGARRGYKNFDRLLQAFAQSSLLCKDFSLICFGDRFSPAEQRRLKDLGLGHKVHQIDGNDSLLLSYYKKARAFVFPSLYEGFGIPLLEAMGAGCPVLCSNRGPFPEIVGDAGIYFNPEDVNNMQSVVEKTLLDDTLLAEMVKRGYQRSSMFSWDRTASRTLALYRSLL